MSIGKSMFEHDYETNDFSRSYSRKSKSKPAESNKPVLYQTEEGVPVGSGFWSLLWQRIRPAYLTAVYRWGHLLTRRNLMRMAILGGVGYFVMTNDKSGGWSGDLEGASIFGADDSDSGGKGKAKKTKYSTKNDAAPVKPAELYEQEAQNYIEKYAEIAQKEQREYGIPASISLAQGLVESRAGTSKLAVNNNNHFGIKCFSRHCKKGHCSNFTDDTHKDFFRKFPAPWESWREHSKLLSRGRYKRLHKYGTDYRAWANGLQSIGYATDRRYAEALIGTIERFKLHRFD